MSTQTVKSGKGKPFRKLSPEEARIFDAFRRWGYLQADLDSLGRLEPVEHAELKGEGEAFRQARQYYCGSVGVEFMHIPEPQRRAWIQERMESEPAPVDRDSVFEDLLRAELFEQILQSRYLGTKRFSLEGTASLIPLLKEMLHDAAERQVKTVLLGMSHRGRLNVMLHVVGKRAADVFAGFEDVNPRSVLGAGDVKYHLGATGTFQARNGQQIALHLVSNPSHLEAVDPVVMGRVRAKQTRAGDREGKEIIPIVMHGDAAFAGQGILAEVLNLAFIPGFSVGGTVHVIVNNLIGFTAVPEELHSSRFASDVAKRIPIPIFHVNAEDPEAVVRVARLALDYRCTFSSDVVVDLIGYRRHGHSEVDDPTITQPLLYRKIQERPPLWQLYAEQTGVSPQQIQELTESVRSVLEEELREAKSMEKIPVLRQLPSYWDGFHAGPYHPSLEVDTGLSRENLQRIAEGLTRYPESFHIHEKVARLLEQRAEMGRGERLVDFGMAEALAFGSLLLEGIPVRLSGQDSRRGTFNQRHSVLIDVENEEEYVPLNHLAQGQACFECYDSMLSEAAVLGYEYGYSRDYPDALVLWEAQFGDFANGAQVIIDQFITPAEDKWALLSGLVMLLPHGYEGQGPEHSSARVERYLQLAAEDNIQVCQPSTAAQYFHLLRRQSLRKWRKPLIVFTPKSMLRHPSACSPLEEFTRPRFLPVVGDPEVKDAQRVILCSGKIGHELKAERAKRGEDSTAIIFLDQLYPFPSAELQAELDRYADARDILWVQEEPANMGALFFVIPRIERLTRGRPVRSVKRSESGSPATGSAKAHSVEQNTLLALAFARRREN